MVKVLFILRRTRGKSCRYFLYCRITCAGASREFSTEEEISHPDLWDQDHQHYRFAGPEGEYISLLIDKLRYSIKSLHLKLNNGSPIHPDELLSRLRKPVGKPVYICDLVQDYILWIRKHKERSEDTIVHYDTYLKNLRQFQSARIPAENFNLVTAEKFKTFLRSERPTGKRKRNAVCKGKTRASRHIEFFSKAFDHAVREGKIQNNPLASYQAERDKTKQVIFLDQEERQAWTRARFSLKILQVCADLYTYQMATGVAYGNVWSKFELKVVPEVGHLIMGTRIKGNKNPFYVPFNAVAKEILDKYNWQLPYVDNSTYNKTIKVVAEILGIKKHLTTHTARKTFNMVMKADGWSLGSRKDMLGHRSARTTELYYEDSSPELVINEMRSRALQRM